MLSNSLSRPRTLKVRPMREAWCPHGCPLLRDCWMRRMDQGRGARVGAEGGVLGGAGKAGWRVKGGKEGGRWKTLLPPRMRAGRTEGVAAILSDQPRASHSSAKVQDRPSTRMRHPLPSLMVCANGGHFPSSLACAFVWRSDANTAAAHAEHGDV